MRAPSSLPRTMLLVTAAVLVAAPALGGDDLTNMKLEDLMNLRVQVISAAKRPQQLSDAAAAIYVITGEDIRRTGASSVPEALRLVPGMQVARLNNGAWAISARGFAGSIANKLLVLVDGRSIYSPLFGGVLWDLQDFMLQDIDRIEVIRGPGATLWGANAVNGVINIITKSAGATRGGFASVGTGSMERGYAEARYGGMIGAETALRISAKYSDWKSTMDSTVAGHFQAPYVTRSIAMRVDSNLTSADTLMASGQLTSSIFGEMEPIPQYVPPYVALLSFRYSEGSAFFNSKWSHVNSETSDYSLRLSYTYEHAGRGGDTGWSNSLEVEFQDHFQPFESHDVVWGLAYKANFMHIGSSLAISATRADVTQDVVSGFLQDDISLIPSQLRATIGTKVEYNNFSGFDVEPSARLIWTPNDKTSLWAAVSRAARTPTMAEHYMLHLWGVIPNPVDPTFPPIELMVTGNREFKSETVTTYELGYRLNPLDNVSLDLAAFYNDSSGLLSVEYGAQAFALTPVPHVTQALIMGNYVRAHAVGFELSGEWQPTQGWRLRGSYAYWNGNAAKDGGDRATTNLTTLGQVPRNQFSFRSSADLPGDLETDITIRYVGALTYTSIGAYMAVDARLGWRPSESFDLSVVGQNLIGPPHTEFNATIDTLPSVAARLGRTVFVKASMTF